LDDAVDTVSSDIHTATDRAVGDEVHVIFDDDGQPLRLTLEPSGGWAVVAVEPLELPRGRAGPPGTGARLALRRVSQGST
jgi:hypothetical protein